MPGCEFEPDGGTAEGFFGMPGTAHLQGIGFMLTQHEAWFGNKKIDNITAWIKPAKTDDTIYNLLVSIADIADDETDQPTEGATQKRDGLVVNRVVVAGTEPGMTAALNRFQ